MESKEIELVTESGININGLSVIDENRKEHFLIYKIENISSGKYYYGQHITDNVLDEYMGSGKLISRAVKKYGNGAFIKTFLFDYDNFEDMNNKEQELVPLSSCWPTNKMSYNLREGGGNFGKLSEHTRNLISEHHANVANENNPMYGKHLSDYMEPEAYKSMTEKHIKAVRARANDPIWLAKMSKVTSGKNNPMYGKDWRIYSTPEKIALHKKRCSIASSGKNNPMYGKDSWAKHTPEERAARIESYRKNMMGKNKGRKMLINLQTDHRIFVKEPEYSEYLKNGYVKYRKSLDQRMTNGIITRSVYQNHWKEYYDKGFHFINRKFEEKWKQENDLQ